MYAQLSMWVGGDVSTQPTHDLATHMMMVQYTLLQGGTDVKGEGGYAPPLTPTPQGAADQVLRDLRVRALYSVECFTLMVLGIALVQEWCEELWRALPATVEDERWAVEHLRLAPAVWHGVELQHGFPLVIDGHKGQRQCRENKILRAVFPEVCEWV